MISFDGMVARGFGRTTASGFGGTMARAIDLLLELSSLELLLRWLAIGGERELHYWLEAS
jgi:phosphatidylglycerophosphate synthase